MKCMELFFFFLLLVKNKSIIIWSWILLIFRLSGCNVSERSCAILCSVLNFQFSSLRELDLSNNDLQDSGVKLLSSGWKKSNCTLESLRSDSVVVVFFSLIYIYNVDYITLQTKTLWNSKLNFFKILFVTLVTGKKIYIYFIII